MTMVDKSAMARSRRNAGCAVAVRRSPLRRRGAAGADASPLAWLFALFVALATAIPVHAEDESPVGDERLSVRVGRLANVQGTVLVAPAGDAQAWSEAGLNHPIAEGDDLRVDADGRAEIDYGGGQFRLAGDTSLHVSRLDERQLALFVAAGRVIVRVRVLESEDDVRVDTPATQVALVRPGLYRIEVAPDSPGTTVVVREGEAQVAAAGGSERLLPGQTAFVSGVAGEPAEVSEGRGIDGFDAWSAARDRVYETPRQHAYVSRQMIGQVELEPYGTWQMYPEYGAVWFPTDVAPDWAPYRFGRWTWLTGFGYTWVDDAPWGYAPFHYGRWAYVDGRWGWCPGTYVARPAWAPALVAWYGGAGWRHSGRRGDPVHAWVPLGWREPFVPSWGRCAATCWARYNRSYGVDLAARRRDPPAGYVNWSAPGGMTAVPATTLARAEPVAANQVRFGAVPAFMPSLVTRPPVGGAAGRMPVVTDSRAPVPASAQLRTRAPTHTLPPVNAGERTVRIAPPRAVSPITPAPSNAMRAPTAPQIAAPPAVTRTPAVPQAVAPPAMSRMPPAPQTGASPAVTRTPAAPLPVVPPSGGVPRIAPLPQPVAPPAPPAVAQPPANAARAPVRVVPPAPGPDRPN